MPHTSKFSHSLRKPCRKGLHNWLRTQLDMSLKSFAKSAGVTAADDLHFVQQRPSKNWSNSGQSGFKQTTSRQRIGSALLFMLTPPVSVFVHDRSSGVSTSLDQHKGQQ